MVEVGHLAGTIGLGAEIARQHIALQLVWRLHAHAGGVVGRWLLELCHALHAPLADAPSARLAAVAPLPHLHGTGVCIKPTRPQQNYAQAIIRSRMKCLSQTLQTQSPYPSPHYWTPAGRAPM